MRHRNRYYIGLASKGQELFRIARNVNGPSEVGHLYHAVIGPFDTKRAACIMFLYGKGNPNLQTVEDAKRMARGEHDGTIPDVLPECTFRVF